MSVRTVFGGRTARAVTNRFDDESLRQVVSSSESLAKVQHPDPDLLPMPTSNEVREASDGECNRPDTLHTPLRLHLRFERRGFAKSSEWRTATSSPLPECIRAASRSKESSIRVG